MAIAIASGNTALIVLASSYAFVALIATFRLATRACSLHSQGLRVRGFWRTYDVQWASLRGLATSDYSFAPVRGAQAFVVFDDLGGVRRTVSVSSNRLNDTARRKARQIQEWVPMRFRADVQITDLGAFGAEDSVGDWRPVARETPYE